MKQDNISRSYTINYSFDEQDNKFVAVCPDFFGFILYCDDLIQLKKNCLKVLKVYTKDMSLSGRNLNFVEKEPMKELVL